MKEKISVTEVQNFIDGINSASQAEKFVILLDRILMCCIHRRDSTVLSRTSNYDAFGKPEDTVYIVHGRYDIALAFNHSVSYRDCTQLSTRYNFLSFAPELQVRLEDEEIEPGNIPVIDDGSSWFQYSTVYSSLDLLTLYIHTYMKRCSYEAFHIDLNYFPELLLASGEDLDEYL